VPDDAGYLAFFTKVIERLEEGAKKVGQLVEEESRDLLARATMRVFSHLLRSDPCFDFEAVIAPIPEVIRDALGEWVEDHVDELSARFAREDRYEAAELEGDDGDSSDVASP
jgi:hypothetical protein